MSSADRSASLEFLLSMRPVTIVIVWTTLWIGHCYADNAFVLKALIVSLGRLSSLKL